MYWRSLYVCVYRHTYHITGWKHNEKAEQIHIFQELNMIYHQSYQTDTGLSLWNNVTMMAQHSPAPLKALRFLCLVCQYFPIQTKYICKQIKIDFEQIWNGIRKSTPQFTQQLCSKHICKGWNKINLNTIFLPLLAFMSQLLYAQYHLYSRLGGHQSWSGQHGENYWPYWDSNSDTASHCTDCSILALN